MHNEFFLKDVAGFLGGYYTFIALVNGVAALILWRKQGRTGWAVTWAGFAVAMLVLVSRVRPAGGPAFRGAAPRRR